MNFPLFFRPLSENNQFDLFTGVGQGVEQVNTVEQGLALFAPFAAVQGQFSECFKAAVIGGGDVWVVGHGGHYMRSYGLV